MTRDEELLGYILEGMARAIWVHAYMIWTTEVDPAPVLHGDTWEEIAPNNRSTRSASMEAARELAGSIAQGNPDGDQAILRAFRWRSPQYDRGGTAADRAYGFGRELAISSIGAMEIPGLDQHLLLPQFEVELNDDGDRLTWDGGWSWHPDWSESTTPPTSNPREWPSSTIQSVLFDKDRYSVAQAKRWAQDHNLKHGSVDTTDHYHRLRQFEPKHGQPCRTIELGHSIKAIVCAVDNPALGIEILLLEDDPKVQAGVVRMVKRFLTNPRVIIADNVGAAIADLEVHEFGLVISDVDVLGSRSGLDFFEYVKTHYPHLVDRFVFFTDSAEAERVHYRYLEKGGATAEDLKRVVRAPAPGQAARATASAPMSAATMSLADMARIVNSALPSIREEPGPSGYPMGRLGDKVFIAAVYRVLSRQPGFRAMTLGVFKQRLVEANQQSLLDLARLDAQGDVDPEELKESEITDRGARFHVITDRAAVARPQAAQTARRMPLDAFANTVLVHANRIQRTDSSDGAMGRFGHKVFVAALWRDLSHDPRIHAMGQSGFKRELWEAHRAGLLELSRADLVGAMDAGEVAQSEIKQGNAEFHFVLDPQALPEALRPSASAMSLDDLSRIVLEALPRIRQHPGTTGRPAGRFGDDKVFIAAVWRQIHDDPRLRGMTMDQFKRQLIVAQRKRLLNLARADLVGAMDGPEVAQSEIEDMGASFHFVLDPNG